MDWRWNAVCPWLWIAGAALAGPGACVVQRDPDDPSLASSGADTVRWWRLGARPAIVAYPMPAAPGAGGSSRPHPGAAGVKEAAMAPGLNRARLWVWRCARLAGAEAGCVGHGCSRSRCDDRRGDRCWRLAFSVRGNCTVNTADLGRGFRGAMALLPTGLSSVAAARPAWARCGPGLAAGLWLAGCRRTPLRFGSKAFHEQLLQGNSGPSRSKRRPTCECAVTSPWWHARFGHEACAGQMRRLREYTPRWLRC